MPTSNVPMDPFTPRGGQRTPRDRSRARGGYKPPPGQLPTPYPDPGNRELPPAPWEGGPQMPRPQPRPESPRTSPPPSGGGDYNVGGGETWTDPNYGRNMGGQGALGRHIAGGLKKFQPGAIQRWTNPATGHTTAQGGQGKAPAPGTPHVPGGGSGGGTGGGQPGGGGADPHLPNPAGEGNPWPLADSGWPDHSDDWTTAQWEQWDRSNGKEPGDWGPRDPVLPGASPNAPSGGQPGQPGQPGQQGGGGANPNLPPGASTTGAQQSNTGPSGQAGGQQQSGGGGGGGLGGGGQQGQNFRRPPVTPQQLAAMHQNAVANGTVQQFWADYGDQVAAHGGQVQQPQPSNNITVGAGSPGSVGGGGGMTAGSNVNTGLLQAMQNNPQLADVINNLIGGIGGGAGSGHIMGLGDAQAGQLAGQVGSGISDAISNPGGMPVDEMQAQSADSIGAETRMALEQLDRDTPPDQFGTPRYEARKQQIIDRAGSERRSSFTDISAMDANATEDRRLQGLGLGANWLKDIRNMEQADLNALATLLGMNVL